MKHFLISLIIPMNLSITLFFIGLVFGILKRKKIFVTLTTISIAWVFIWSLPVTSIVLGSYLENKYPIVSLENIPHSDAIVVLGGHTANNRNNWFESTEEVGKHSRVDTADGLYFAGKAKYILVSGGALEGDVSEAKGMAYVLRKAGVPSSALLLEQESRTTHENAVLSNKVLKENHIKTIILVTSALHMPRAMAVFDKTDMKVFPSPNPPQIVVPNDPDFNRFIPNYRALNASRSILKEYIGLLAYYFRGWA